MRKIFSAVCGDSCKRDYTSAKKSKTRAELHNLVDTLNEEQLRYTYAFLSKVFERKEK